MKFGTNAHVELGDSHMIEY